MMNEFKYRIIDMHAHIFPDKIASRAVESIGSYYNIPMSGPAPWAAYWKAAEG